MQLRDETPGDVPAIHELNARAFAGVEYSDGSEPRIVDRLRAEGDLAVSLVLADGEEIVGHIAFSPVHLAGPAEGEPAGDSERQWYGLGPVAVDPAAQGRGHGRTLIEAGLERLRSLGAAGCVLVGDPALYSRFGFASGGVSYPGLDSAFVQWIVLDGGSAPNGEAVYSPGFAG